MPNPVAVAPAGGPQPAKKRKTSTYPGEVYIQTESSQPYSVPSIPRVPVGPVSADAAAQRATYVPDWKPSLSDLQDFLGKFRSNQESPGILDILGGNMDSLSGRKRSAGVDMRSITEEELAKILASANKPADIVAGINELSGSTLSEDSIQPLIDSAAVQMRDQHNIDMAAGANRRAAEQFLANQSSAPARGGSTPDSIDRGVDPLSMVQDRQLSSTELTDLAAQIHAQDALQGPAMLEQAKTKILSDAMAYEERASQITNAYKAGLAGAPIPEIPKPGEPTDQGRYATAGDVSPTATPFTPTFGNLDTTQTDEAILAAAGLIERKRVEEGKYQAMQALTDQAQAQAQREREIESLQREADRAKETSARKADQAVWKDQAFDAYFKQSLNETVNETNFKDPEARVAQIDEMASLFAQGLSKQDVIYEVFKTEKGTDIPKKLGPKELQLLELAEMKAKRSPTAGRKSDYATYQAKYLDWAARQANQ